MVKSQNDIYMVIHNALDNDDNLMQEIENGSLDREYLRKSANNLLRFILKSPAFGRKTKIVEEINMAEYTAFESIEDVKAYDTLSVKGAEVLEFEYAIDGSELSQHCINVYNGEEHWACAMVQGTEGVTKTTQVKLLPYTKQLNMAFSTAFKFVNVTAYKKEK